MSSKIYFLLFTLFFFSKSYSQIIKWRATSVVTASFKTGDTTPVKPKTDSCNYIIVFNLDKQRIIVNKGDYELDYDCISYTDVKSENKDLNEILIKAVNNNGNSCKINLQFGKDDTQFKGFDGQLQVIYSSGCTIYYFRKID